MFKYVGLTKTDQTDQNWYFFLQIGEGGSAYGNMLILASK